MIVTIFSLFKHLRKLRESVLLPFPPMFYFPSFTCKNEVYSTFCLAEQTGKINVVTRSISIIKYLSNNFDPWRVEA